MIDLEKVNHTNRELELMLSGHKPLAVFYAEVSELPDEELIPEQRFEKQVAINKMTRSEMIVPGLYSEKLDRNTQIKYVFFALKNEEWRISAFRLLIEQLEKTGVWDETCERMECTLLGYSEEETEAWCKKGFSRNAL